MTVYCDPSVTERWWPRGHREIYDALKAAGIDTDDLVGVCEWHNACRIINERLSAAGCNDLPQFGESLDESIARVRRWAERRSA